MLLGMIYPGGRHCTILIILCVGRGVGVVTVQGNNWQTDTLKEGQWLGREVSTNYVNFAFPAQLGLSLETTHDNNMAPV